MQFFYHRLDRSLHEQDRYLLSLSLEDLIRKSQSWWEVSPKLWKKWSCYSKPMDFIFYVPNTMDILGMIIISILPLPTLSLLIEVWVNIFWAYQYPGTRGWWEISQKNCERNAISNKWIFFLHYTMEIFGTFKKNLLIEVVKVFYASHYPGT